MPRSTTLHRGSLDAWLGKLVLPVLFWVVLIATLQRLLSLPIYFAVLGWSLVGLIYSLDVLLPLITNWLVLDSAGMSGCIDSKVINLRWTEVVAVWRSSSLRGWRLICLGTRRETVVLPVRFFDEARLWTRLGAALPPAVFEPCALSNVPDWLKWQRSMVEEQQRCLEMIEHNLSLRTRGMLWEDVREIEMDPFCLVMVLHGKRSRSIIAGPALWRVREPGARNSRRVLMQLEHSAHDRKIPVRQTLWALLGGTPRRESK